MVETTEIPRRMTRPLMGLLVATLALSACSERQQRILFDGNYYPTKEKAVSKDDRNEFEVTVRRAERGIDGAREAGRHGGTTYCLKNFGTSNIEWAIGPDQPAENLKLNNGNLRLTGRCVTW